MANNWPTAEICTQATPWLACARHECLHDPDQVWKVEGAHLNGDPGNTESKTALGCNNQQPQCKCTLPSTKGLTAAVQIRQGGYSS